MALRDKSAMGGSVIKDKSSLALLDIRGKDKDEKHSVSRVFLSEWFDLQDFCSAHKEADTIEGQGKFNGLLKQYISMKYVFVIGDPSDFDTENFKTFLKIILDGDGKKPFKMFLYKFTEQILEAEFPYLWL
mmetsp:Transcript_31357/g.47957  ORF Transcript_31357/g.47957 Transcript_31357/m.47957 type:complete len:131 (-) Transcript_31357:557-949(-)|eukprot:CAMPEP_0170505328 /NCGR_PEP_ID=MMETSP0208-20121228/50476_1 /TAXON_ID=197538 /ORGANISM="Strombidium inclinatum, Strain S3" /LENGTH=130 /DNA_ID=CAMNT_0010786107 /DNA_START=110 /DNA_END=502 /DNA_ORIENTATION=+